MVDKYVDFIRKIRLTSFQAFLVGSALGIVAQAMLRAIGVYG